MLIAASSCLAVLFSLIFSTAQAFFPAPVPDFVHGVSIFNVDDSKRAGNSGENNEVTIRHAGNNVDVDDDDNNDVNDDDDDDVDDVRANEPEVRDEEQTVVLVEFESELSEKMNKNGNKADKEDDSDNQSPLDPWSIVWYIGSFGGLVAFFLIVSCSEWCCRRGARQLNSSYVQRGNNTGDQPNAANGSTETPPPPYHLFAPPPYDSVNYGDLVDKTSGEKIDIYVISVPLQSTAHQPAPA